MSSTPAESKRQVRPFSMRDKIGYMFGDFGNDFTFILQSTFFMVFYTNVVGIKAAHVGTLFLVARCLDAFTDVGMGILVDRVPIKKGGTKFKRWIKIVAIPVAIASALMYMSFVADWESYNSRLVWMCCTYFLWGSICYTAINIPYGSMASVVSDNPDDRAQLSVFRSTGANLANLLLNAVVPIFVYTKTLEGVSNLNGPRMTIAAIACAVAAVICYSLCYINVEERVVATPAEGEDKQKGESIGKMLGSLFTNKALLTIVLAALCLLIGMMFLGGILPYILLSYFGNGQLQSPASMVALIPAFALIVLAPMWGKRFGKAETGVVAMFIGGAVLLVAYFLKIQNAWVWIIFYGVAMFCIAIFNFLIWAFITDVIDYQEVRSGYRDDGTTYAIYSWARKLGQAFAGFLTGHALTMVGFDSAAAKAGEAQSQSAIDGIYMLTNVLPGVFCLLVAIVLLFLYPLKKQAVLTNTAILRARRKGEVHAEDPLAKK